MPKNKLTRRQKDVLNALDNYTKEKGYAPSIREIAEIVHLASSSTVYGHLEKLKENGYVTWEPSQPRTLRIIKTAS